MSLKVRLKNNLTPVTYRRLARVAKTVFGWWYRNDLNRLALLFNTDKWGSWYTQHYQRYFQPLKHKRLNVLEIGVGGYKDSNVGGRITSHVEGVLPQQPNRWN
jgi:hypothetical protein